MSKAKVTIEELRNKLFEKKKQESVEKAQELIEKNMDNVTYEVIQNPNTKARSFLIVKIKFDLETKEAAVVEVREFKDKAAGLSIQMNKENIKYLFNKNRSNNENK